MVARSAGARGALQDLIGRLARQAIEIAEAPSTVLAAVSPVRSASPIVAIADRPARSQDTAYKVDLPLVVIACDVQDPGNLGAIIRVAEAAGASGLVAAGESADPFGWKTLRGSMGSALRLPVVNTRNTAEAIAQARQHGCRSVAAIPRRGRSLFDAGLRGPLAILVGGEGAGLPAAIVDAADERVTIPMERPVESLNTAVAAALVVYEVRRRRTHGPTLPR
jgi:TrmH family RNA methyltransferase